MTGKLPPSASVALPLEQGKLFAPSAERNVPAILALLEAVAPAHGRTLEIASGTGQHVTAFAAALPALRWYPTEIAPDRLASIDAYATAAGLPNLYPATILNAACSGWGTSHTPYDLIYLGNLLHLIPRDAAQTVLQEAAQALTPTGRLVIYGPFMRAGVLTSEGDRKFHGELCAADPEIGYKNDDWVRQVLVSSRLTVTEVREMPANNLSFITQPETT
ncbi:MAG: DUF938 domain-containing protein [Sulfitobacter sp.]|nr:DUF938 domain-containing protein [Sulfitobacter sp.]